MYCMSNPRQPTRGCPPSFEFGSGLSSCFEVLHRAWALKTFIVTICASFSKQVTSCRGMKFTNMRCIDHLTIIVRPTVHCVNISRDKCTASAER